MHYSELSFTSTSVLGLVAEVVHVHDQVLRGAKKPKPRHENKVCMFK